MAGKIPQAKMAASKPLPGTQGNPTHLPLELIQLLLEIGFLTLQKGGLLGVIDGEDTLISKLTDQGELQGRNVRKIKCKRLCLCMIKRLFGNTCATLDQYIK